MAQMGYTADANDLPEKSGDFEVIPAGDQPMRAIDAQVKPTSKGGMMVAWTFEITDGKHAGRRIWSNVNIQNPPGYVPTGNGDPARIGQQQNNQFAAAIGLINGADDTDNYLMKPFIGRVAVEPAKNGFGPKNKIAAFKPFGGGSAPMGNGATTGQPAAQTSTAPSAGSANTPPWKR